MSNNITRLLRASLFTPTSDGWGLPILFWGKPGIGKSAIIEQIARAHDLPCEILSPGERGEGAFGVTPMPDADGYISYPPPRWVEQFMVETIKGKTTGGRGFLFVDELTTAPPAIQSALLGLLLKKRIGGAVLPGGVRIVGAANAVADAAGGWDLAPPVANRLGHIDWEAPNESEWSEWLMSEVDSDHAPTEPAAQLEARVMQAWPNAWAKARGLVAGFVRRVPNALHKQPPSGHPDASRAWPSHRSWEFATRAIASGIVHNLSEADGDTLAASFVGAGVIGELIEYRNQADLPDPVDLLDGKVKFAPDFKRLDRTYAVLGATTAIVMSGVAAAGGAAEVKKDKVTFRRLGVLVDLLNETAEGAVDLVWSSAKALANAGVHDITPESAKLLKRLKPMVDVMANGSR